MCSIAGIMAWLSLCRVRLWGEEDRRISLFIEYEDDVCYLDDNDHLTEYRSGEWKQYIVDLNSQFYEIEGIFIGIWLFLYSFCSVFGCRAKYHKVRGD